MTTITCINPENYKIYYVKAKMVKDFEATSSGESVAWNGTLQLYKTTTNKFFIEHHSGLSGTPAISVEITDYCNTPEMLTLDEAQYLYDSIAYA
jgi:hypothetical protein